MRSSGKARRCSCTRSRVRATMRSSTPVGGWLMCCEISFTLFQQARGPPRVDGARRLLRSGRAGPRARPATTSAAAAFSTTTSRAGPARALSSSRANAGALGGIAAREATRASQRSRPASCGWTVNSRRARRPRRRSPCVGAHERELVEPGPVHHPGAAHAEARQAAREERASAPGRGTPTTCASGSAGLVSGPRRLKAVRTPSSLRGADRVPRGGVERRREQERPAARRRGERCTVSTRRVERTPSASSTSALPQLPLAERLPCLATGTPQAATTSEASVEMLKRAGAVAAGAAGVDGTRATLTRGARARMARAKPTTSSSVSPRAAIAPSSAPICAGVASPSMMTVMASRRLALRRAAGRAMTLRRTAFMRHRQPSGSWRSRSLPAAVRMLSGWNCTPSSGMLRDGARP